jgi:hypothetical protein
MNKNLNEQEMLRRLTALPRGIAPQQDAWPKISARISQTDADTGPVGSRFRRRPLAIAASFLIILAAGVLVERHWFHSAAPFSGKDLAQSSAYAESESHIARSSNIIEMEYQAAVKEFMALNAVPETASGPEPQWIEQGWGTLRKIELELSEAIRGEPDNDFLNSRMAALRARQIGLLRQIAAVDRASRSNTI